MNEPTASFIVPCYNYGRYVAQAVDSLLNQTVRNVEVIVINDASPDDTAEVLDRYEAEARVRVINHPTNLGHIASYNEGLALARGDFLGILSADDFACSDTAVEKQLDLFENNPDVGFVYSAYSLVDSATNSRTRSAPRDGDCVERGLLEFSRLMWGNYVPASGTLVRRRCHNQLGWYDPALPHAGDWDLWLRILTCYDVAYISEELYAYRMHANNMSHTRISPRQHVHECLAVLEKNFALLPKEAKDIFVTKETVRRHVALVPMWQDLYNDRLDRAWRGVWSALLEVPSLITTRVFCSATLRLLRLSLATKTARTPSTLEGRAP